MLRMQDMAFQTFSGGACPHIRDHCYPPLISNHKLWLIFFFTFCAFLPFSISNTSIVSINFGVNLDAQNAGNDISVLQISKILDPPFTRGMSPRNVAFSNCYPPLIYYLTERSLFKKSLKRLCFRLTQTNHITLRNCRYFQLVVAFHLFHFVPY